MAKPTIIEQAVDVLKIEAEGILGLIDGINDSFVRMADMIFNTPGRTIVSGIGKSGIVARKIVATLNSTGTRSLFLHPVEAMHGDLGMVGQDDIVIALSNSGETDELNLLLQSIRKIGCKVIAFTGNRDSTLARLSNVVIDVGVKKEACPLGLAPTASSTAMLAMGDALAVVLLNQKHFKSSDFKKIHPGGRLGQRLSCDVRDFMLTGKAVPQVPATASMTDVVKEIDRHGLGVALIVGPDSLLKGIITDGDIRRCVVKTPNIFQLPVADVMTQAPQTIGPGTPAYDALNLMEKYQITVLPITGDDGQVQGLLHLHDVLGKGAFKFNGT